MEMIKQLFGEGDELTIGQMSLRGIVVFAFALALIRISGRRSFGFKSPVDLIITMMLGAVLSRAVVGASPFFAVLVTSFLIVFIHRCLSWVMTKKPVLRKYLEGEKILLYENGTFVDASLKRALLCREDIMTGVREAVSGDDLNEVEKIYLEYNGRITVIKKSKHYPP
jgi:uncharacterized membrane protein YcaP (DUF421 family)